MAEWAIGTCRQRSGHCLPVQRTSSGRFGATVLTAIPNADLVRSGGVGPNGVPGGVVWWHGEVMSVQRVVVTLTCLVVAGLGVWLVVGQWEQANPSLSG